MLTLEVITPTGKALSVEASTVTAPGVSGQFQVLDHHLPLLTILGSGSLSYEGAEGKKGEVLIRGGVAEVSREGKVLVLTDEVQHLDKLDKDRAQSLKEQAEATLSGGYVDDATFERVHQDLRFAEVVLSR